MSANACSNSDAFQLGFGSTTAPPARLTPCWAMIHSGRFVMASATRVPGPKPSASRALANEFPVLSSSRYV